jgi:hypothetical protein
MYQLHAGDGYANYLKSLNVSAEAGMWISRLMIYFAAFDPKTVDTKHAVERIAALEQKIQAMPSLSQRDKEVFFMHSAIGKHSMVYWSDFTKALEQKTLAVKDFSPAEMRIMDEQVKELPVYSLDQLTVWAYRDAGGPGGGSTIWPIITTNILGQPFVSGIGGPGLTQLNVTPAEYDALIRYWNRRGTGGSSAVAAAVAADGSAIGAVFGVASFSEIIYAIVSGPVSNGAILGFAASSSVAAGLIYSSYTYWDIMNNP